VPTPDAQFQVATAAAPCGRRTWHFPSSGPLPPATAPRAARAARADPRVRGLGRSPRRCGPRRDHLGSRGVRLAQETRQGRYAVVGELAEAIAAVEMGADAPAEQLIESAEATLLPLGRTRSSRWSRSRAVGRRSRMSALRRRTPTCFGSSIRATRLTSGSSAAMFWPTSPTRLSKATATVSVCGSSFPGASGATATGAPQLDVQLRYAEASSPTRGMQSPFTRARWRRGRGLALLRRARAARVRRLAPAAASDDRVACAAARGRAVVQGSRPAPFRRACAPRAPRFR